MFAQVDSPKLRKGAGHMKSDAFLTSLVSSSDDAIIGKTLDGTVLFWNEGAERLYGYRADELLGHDISVLIPLDRPLELSELLGRVRSGEIVRNFTTRRIRRDGTTVDVSITVSPVIDDDGTVLSASTIAHDLSLNNQYIADLREARRRADETLSTLETLQQSAPIGLAFVDREFRFIRLNQVFASLTGSTVECFLGKTVAEAVPEIWPQVELIYRRVLENNESVVNIEVTGANRTEPGRRRHWLASYYPVRLETEIIGVGIVVVDVTERREADEFRSIAMNQMVEGLFLTDDQGRMTYMNSAVTKMLGWTESDLKGRHLHDLIHTHHEDGTPILSEAECQHQLVRTEGRTVRGDDEVFTCKDGSRLPVAYSAAPLSTGAGGDGTVVVFRDVAEERLERLRVRLELEAVTWVGRIHEALDEDRLVLYSQPIVPLAGGQPSEELLLRMVGRSGELISPGDFLGVAEKYGLITEIDRWVVKRAVRLAAKGSHLGINLSAESITAPDFLEFIETEVSQSGACPSNLVFEITETALMNDIEKAHVFALGIVDLGCSLALDDFGTGFGTFTHVKRLPIGYLKIDIEFVRDLVDNDANQHVVKAIVNLAQGFGCRTIAEGVEDGDTLDLLKEFGVDFAQGYYLGRPAPMGPAVVQIAPDERPSDDPPTRLTSFPSRRRSRRPLAG
jgi:PAS domain S-box-containing protein